MLRDQFQLLPKYFSDIYLQNKHPQSKLRTLAISRESLSSTTSSLPFFGTFLQRISLLLWRSWEYYCPHSVFSAPLISVAPADFVFHLITYSLLCISSRTLDYPKVFHLHSCYLPHWVTAELEKDVNKPLFQLPLISSAKVRLNARKTRNRRQAG